VTDTKSVSPAMLCCQRFMQIYKSYLTNKVLQDPRQRRFFAAKDITDLFTLADEHGGGSKRRGSRTPAAAAGDPLAATETGRIFSDVVQEQKLPALPPTAGVAAAGRGKRPAGAAASRVQRRDGQAAGSLQQQQPGSREDEESPPVSPTARATAGLAVIAPARDSTDAAAAGDDASAGAGGSGGRSHASGARKPARRQDKGGGASSSGAGDDDAKVLRDLFEGVGIKSLMDHTSIEGAHDPEAREAAAAAAKLAERAAEKVRQSRLACQAAAVHVPTWTGRHGAAGLQMGRTTGSGSNRRSSPMQPAAGAAEDDGRGAAAAPKGRFGRVVNPLLTARPLYAAPPAAAAAPSPGSSSAADRPQSERSPALGDGSASDGAQPGRPAGLGGSTVAARAFSGQLAGTTGGAAPSSAALLAQLRQRQASIATADAGLAVPRQFGRANTPGQTSPSPEPPASSSAAAGATAAGDGDHRGSGAQYSSRDGSASEETAAVALAEQISDFIQAAGGSAKSEALVAHFGSMLQASEMPLFKQLLRRVAKLQPGAQGQGKVWVLQPTNGGVS